MAEDLCSTGDERCPEMKKFLSKANPGGIHSFSSSLAELDRRTKYLIRIPFCEELANIEVKR